MVVLKFGGTSAFNVENPFVLDSEKLIVVAFREVHFVAYEL